MKVKKEDIANAEAAAAITGDSITTCFVTAILLYRKLIEERQKKSTFYIEERNGNLRRITIL